jgi:hypothetical protein
MELHVYRYLTNAPSWHAERQTDFSIFACSRSERQRQWRIGRHEYGEERILKEPKTTSLHIVAVSSVRGEGQVKQQYSRRFANREDV